jgi:glycosyltransferase involved in cell wall biosynthesis
MRIIILTQYYPPETGAPQNRLSDLAQRLHRSGVEVTVHTAMPNYPQMKKHRGYRWRFYKKERVEGITVHRSWIYCGTSKRIIPRLFNYFSFVITSVITGIFVLRRSDFLLVESPPLFLGYSAYILSRCKRAKMIFNVSDLWPESAEKLGLVTSRRMLRMAYGLERFCYRKSAFVTGQTQGICRSISERFPGKTVQWLPNGVDMDSFVPCKTDLLWRSKNGFGCDDFLILYAGIIGHAQGLEVIIRAAEILKEYPSIHFIILGSGPEKDGLINMVEEKGISNVTFPEGVARKEMPEIIASVNASVVPLKKLELFTGAIPSKIFEALAMEKPILLGVEGEAYDLFVKEAQAALFFEPENAEDLARQTLALFNKHDEAMAMGKRGREFAIRRFNRKTIAESLKELMVKQLYTNYL